ncbi:hypothetical protein LIA77_10170 [Sarocladium implicatum]|nr:hypothetical protein LIA77_10170 [Sarocladium implicatum]
MFETREWCIGGREKRSRRYERVVYAPCVSPSSTLAWSWSRDWLNAKTNCRVCGRRRTQLDNRTITPACRQTTSENLKRGRREFRDLIRSQETGRCAPWYGGGGGRGGRVWALRLSRSALWLTTSRGFWDVVKRGDDSDDGDDHDDCPLCCYKYWDVIYEQPGFTED